MKKNRPIFFSALFSLSIAALSADEPGVTSSPLIFSPLATSYSRTFAGRLVPHDSIYFLYGSEAPAAKFQFSFKYRLLNAWNEDTSSDIHPSLNIAFTQRSLWDIDADSSPFFDSSYMPELLFETSSREPKTRGLFTWFGQQLSMKHESNGRDGVSSRGLDTIYYRPLFAIGSLENWHVILAPKVFTYLGGLDDNLDLPHYRGYGQIRGAILKGNGASLGYTVHSGKDLDHLTYELDLRIPIEIEVLNLAAFLHLQYFNGYGESLLSYDRKSDAFRFGFSIVR